MYPRALHEYVGTVRGATMAEKLRGTKVFVSTPGRLRSGWVLGAGGGHPWRCEGFGYHPRKIFENSDAKSCILVSNCCEISRFSKTTAKKLGDQYIVGPPNLKVGGPVSPGPYGCCAYGNSVVLRTTCYLVIIIIIIIIWSTAAAA